MRRLLYYFFAITILGLAAGCSREVADVSREGDLINACFNVSLPDDMATKAISDGTLADELTFIAFDENGRQIAGLDQTVPITNKKATVTANLIRGVHYTFAFWAQKTGQYAVSYSGNDAEHPYIVITTEQLPKMMNSDDYDAFFGTLSLKKDADFEENVFLTRPFAQINLAVDTEDYDAAVASGLDMATVTSSFVFERQDGLKNQLQLFDGAVARTSDFTGSVTCDKVAIPGDLIASGNNRYNRIAMLYVLAPADPDETATLDLSVTVNAVQNGNIPVAITRDVANVPVRKNFRTNIIGKLFSIDGTFTVTLSEGFEDPDNTVNVGTPAQSNYTVSIASGISLGTVTFTDNTTAATEFEERQTVTLVVTPAKDYKVEKVYYIADGGQTEQTISKDAISGQYTFSMPNKNVTVYATFTSIFMVAEQGTDYLAANNDGNLDDNISYNNSTSYNAAVSELRVYKTQDLLIQANDGYTIKKIELTCTGNGTAKYGPGCWGTGAPDGYTFESSGRNGTWEGSAQSVMFTASGDQVRITNMKVTYVKD